jgi:hypothetical protein
MPGDVICNIGDICLEMYFITEGVWEIESMNEENLKDTHFIGMG